MAASQRRPSQRRRRSDRSESSRSPSRRGAATPTAPESGRWKRIWSIVSRIPRGRVATYGQIAELAGLPGRARQVGYALAALRAGSRVPWQRVINARGGVSPRAEPGWERLQRRLLEAEGVRFDARGRTDLERFGWRTQRAAGERSAGSRQARSARRRA